MTPEKMQYWHASVHDESVENTSGECFRIALAGNPNCGKTTIFNILTGSRQHVGNYPGVTVERKIGRCTIGGMRIEVIDLPGIYSLSNSSPEEKVAFNELLHQKIDLVLNVIDAGNPQRNLYLTTQLAELNLPMLMVFNMIDDAKNRGIEFDFPMLERYFGAKIVTTVGSSGEGMDKLRGGIVEMLKSGSSDQRGVRLSYGESTDAAVDELTKMVERSGFEAAKRLPARYFAIKLLENDPELSAEPRLAEISEAAAVFRNRLAARHGVSHETFMADRRYGMISGACREAIKISNDKRRQVSDNIDKIATNRFLGVPIFMAVMFLVFTFTFTCAEPLTMAVEWFFNQLANGIGMVWPEQSLPFFRALILDGVIGGVGGVLIFLPNIIMLFLAIAFLEGTGYMARAAFVMDGFMHKIGLHGKSFIPMLLGFGCSVPAIMATRTIESTRDRLTTIMVIPLMSCGARLPIYTMLIPAFFPGKAQSLVLWSIYLIGVVLAMAGARLLKSTLFKGGDEVFVMELPPYRMPTLFSLMIHMWERSVMYLRKAGTLILGASIILFVLNTFPVLHNAPMDGRIAELEQMVNPSDEDVEQLKSLEAGRRAEALRYSLAGRIGSGLAVVLRPIGFDWKVSSALIGAFAGKELFVSQLSILYSVADDEPDVAKLQSHLRESYSPLQGFCIMLFCLISMPCVATVAVVRRETNSWLLTILQLAGLTVLAYGMTLIVYQGGRLLNIGTALL
ncbi:MAG: ferrous iron transport protein B [Victivallaceae bacterium]|nr:ferrous iron transport protein B [Victivallaceae bacterium]